MRLVPLLLLAAAASGQPNPFAPLTAAEIRSTVRILRESGRVPRAVRFSSIALDEPPKDAVLHSQPSPRRAFAVLYDPKANQTWEAVADLSAANLVSTRLVPGAQPAITGEDSDEADHIMRADPRFRQAMAARGIHDLNRVLIVAWSAGYFALPGTETGRMVRAVCYYAADSNWFGHPIEGVVADVDLRARKVVEFTDIDRNAPVSRENFELHAPGGAVRPPPAPLHITQPAGPDFHIENGEVRWQNWRFRFGMHPREGLVLYTVGLEDGGRVRPVLYRGSLSEMVVPYGDPGGGWFFRNSFDAGELGLGISAATERPGVECPENCTTFDATFADEAGTPQTIPGAVALYERDSMIAWKHAGEARRARELVLGYITTVGNYDYGFDWIFHQDGTLEVRVTLTGVMAVKGVADGMHDPFGHMVAKNLEAPHHQHFFTFRLDMDVDGPLNRVVEMNSVPVPAGPRNPYGGAFTMEDTPLRTEREAPRNVNIQTSRKWIVVNPGARNELGQPTGYALLPGGNVTPLALPDSWVRKRAGLLNADLWVTPYRADERYAAGDYPNQSHGGDGLPRWTGGNRAIDNQDVVLWYTMGVTHNPRPEDWPVMPAETLTFSIVPWGFFARNPVLDLPR